MTINSNQPRNVKIDSKTVNLSREIRKQPPGIDQFNYMQQHLPKGGVVPNDGELPDTLFFMATECKVAYFGDPGREWRDTYSPACLIALGLEIAISYAENSIKMAFPTSSVPAERIESDFAMAQDFLIRKITMYSSILHQQYDIQQLVKLLDSTKESAVMRALMWGTLCKLKTKQLQKNPALLQLLSQLLPITQKTDAGLYQLNLDYAHQYLIWAGGEEIKAGKYEFPLFVLKKVAACQHPLSAHAFLESFLSEYVKEISKVKLPPSKDPYLKKLCLYLMELKESLSPTIQVLADKLLKALPKPPK